MGGGSWCLSADASGVVYVGADGNLWAQGLEGGQARELTAHGPDRSAVSPSVAPDGSYVAYVIDLAEVHLVDLRTGSGRRIDASETGVDDFCIDPAWSSDGATVEWVAWNVPDMPWDHTVVRTLSIHDGRRTTTTPDGAIQQPRRMPDGRRLAVRDDRGWLNVHLDDHPLVEEPFEHAGPTWGPGQCSFAWSPDGTRIAFTRNERGFGRLCIVDIATRRVHEVGRGVHGQLSWQGDRLAALRSGAVTPTQLVVYDTTSWKRTIVDVGAESEWSAAELVEPEPAEIPAERGVVHARIHRAEASAAAHDDVSAHGLIVWLHGGPTDQWQVTFMPRFAFWRSRGWNIVVPDHRGSTGHGREYQQALRGRWGELDVSDTVSVIEWAHAHGLGTPSTTVVMGGSAGGFTALGVVRRAADRIAAAVVAYPVTDLTDLVERSHRFERHYTDSLVGPLPANLALAQSMSPAFHTDAFTSTPLLLLHGDVDPVVPLAQSLVFAERVRAAGGDVTVHVYSGEGHGFRQPANQLDEYERVEGFLARHVRIASRS